VEQFIVSIHAGADSAGEVSEPGSIAAGASGGVGASEACLRAGRAVDCAAIKESSDASAVLSEVSASGVNASSTGSVGRTAILALVGAFLASCSVHEEAAATGASEGDIV